MACGEAIRDRLRHRLYRCRSRSVLISGSNILAREQYSKASRDRSLTSCHPCDAWFVHFHRQWFDGVYIVILDARITDEILAFSTDWHRP